MAQGGEVDLLETPVDSVVEIVAELRDGYRREHMTRDYRVGQLKAIKRMLEENRDAILDALWKDLHKAHQEAMMTEYNPVLVDLSLALSNIDQWMAPEYVGKSLLHRFNSAYVQPEPYGVVLIMSPWNYPLILTLQPLIGAIAAGNACVVKPSELSIHTSNILCQLIPSYLDKACCHIITGGIEVSKAVVGQCYDYILYTGSSSVGRYVMKQAAEHLTPMTLELGGKSPCIIADDANIDVAARRIIWGKCTNAGQSCIAPDYILCSLQTQERLVEAFQKTIVEYYGQDPKDSKHYGRIVNRRHFHRLLSLLDSVRGKVAYGGESDEDQLYISPTIITNVTKQDGIMSEEIFGPLLPVVPIENIDMAIQLINEREHPLALYVFTESSDVLKYINIRTSVGGVTHNDTLLHFTVPTLPFGGVGESGFGNYHGKFTFKTFSHYKAVLSAGTGSVLEGMNNIRYPPYTDEKLNDATCIQSPESGALTKLFRVAYLVSKSAAGHPPHS